MLLQQLKYFVAVAETGSLSSAANRLFVTQPNLSKTIANLEDEYKTKLFNRTARGMSLTKEGNLLYHNAKVILKGINELDVTFGIIDPNSEKKLIVAAPHLNFADLATVSYYRSHKDKSNYKCHIEIKNLQSDEIIECVSNRTAEIGFIYELQQQFPSIEKSLHQNDLEFTEIGASEIYVSVGPLNPIYDNDSVKLGALNIYPLICHQEKESIFHKNYSEPGYINLSKFDKLFLINSDFAKINFLRTTDAIYIGGIWSMMDVSQFGIKTIKVLECNAKYTLHWIKRKNETLSEDAQEYIKAIEKYCKQSKDEASDSCAQRAAFKLRDFTFLDK